MYNFVDESRLTGTAPTKGSIVKQSISMQQFVDEDRLTGLIDAEREARQGPSKLDFAKDVGKRALGLTAATGDLLLGVPGSIAGHLMNVGTRLYAAARGEPAKIAGQAGELAENLGELTIPGTDVKIPLEGLKSPLQTIMKTALGVEPWNQDIVSNAMEAAGKGIEKASGGKVTSEDVKLGFGIFMDTAGAAGLRAGAKAITAKAKPSTGKEARSSYVEDIPEEAPVLPDEAPFRQQMPEIPTAAEQAKVRAARMKDVKTAFKDNDEVAYWRSQADQVMEGKAQELINEAERKGRDTSPYDQAKLGEEVSKIVNEKPGYERTAEDLIKIREWNRQAFRSQSGRVDPEMLPYIMAATTVGTAGGIAVYKYLKHLGETDPEQSDEGLFQIGTLGGGLLAAGAVRVKGSGVWPKEAVARLSGPLKNKLGGRLEADAFALPEAAQSTAYKAADAADAWADKAIRNHLNKYFGTAEDPLTNIKIPMLGDDVTWGEVADKVVKSAEIPKRLEMIKNGEAQPGESIWDVEGRQGGNGRGTARHFTALQSYLSHVGDYAREFIPIEKLGQYDLVRLIKETAKQDERQAKKMAAAQAKGEGTTLYKQYPDGMKWVEVGKVEPLKELPEGWRVEGNAKEGYKYVRPLEGGTEGIARRSPPYRTAEEARVDALQAATQALGDKALRNEGDVMGHCVGGYCEAVHNGESKIFSLRDAKGMSHVTVEVSPADVRQPALGVADFWKQASQEIRDRFPDPTDDTSSMRLIARSPEYAAWIKQQPESILQIKGKQNRAPVAAYLPYVQDFVKSGKWGEVGDLQNTGLTDIQQSKINSVPYKNLADELYPGQRYLTDTEFRHMQDTGVQRTLAADGVPRGPVNLGLGIDAVKWAKENKGLAALTAGAALGAWNNEEHPIKGAAYGLAIGALLSRANPKGWVEAYRKAQTSGPINRIEDLIRQHQYEGRVLQRSTSQMVGRILSVAKDPARRDAIYDYLEHERPTRLTPEEQRVAADVRGFLDGLGAVAKEAKVVPHLIEDYVTRIYGQPNQGTIVEAKIGGIKSSSPFGKPRAFKTRAEAEAAGFIPKTTDIAQVVQIYAESVGRAVAGQELVNALKLAKTPEGIPLIAKMAKAPPGYVQAPGEQLRGWVIHPDIAPDVHFVFQAYKPGAILGALEAINSTQKRMGVSLSGFHVTALEQALAGATSLLKSPRIGLKALGQGFAPAVFGESLAVRMIRGGGQGDAVDFALKSGLEISFEHLGPNIAEERPGMYKGLQVATKFLDETVPGMGRYTTGAVLKLNHMFDEAMWARFQAALKLETFWDRQAALERNSAKAVEAGRLEKMPSKEEIGRKTASFTNDMFGGLNWYTLVTEMNSRWGRELASAVFSAPGRFAQRMLLFAPDWTISTTRAFAKSFGPLALATSAGAVVGSQADTESTQSKLLGGVIGAALGAGAGAAMGLKAQTGSGIRGLLQPTELADLHRQYFLRSAFLYTAIGDGINYYMSGHHFWENKDPTRIDRGDGTTWQLSKHFMEPFHWLIDPKKQAMGKASFLIKETAAQLSDTEYWSPHGAPRMGKVPKEQDIPIGARVEHAGKQFAPISAQGFEPENPEKALWSMAGMPVYGKTYEERAKLKAEQKVLRSSPAYKRKLEERKKQRERERQQQRVR